MHSKSQRRHGSPMAPMRSQAPLVPSPVNPSQPKPFRVPRDGAHSPFSRAPHAVYPPKGARGRPCVSVPVVSLEKMPGLGKNEGAHVRLNCTSTTSSSSSSSSAASMLKPSHKPQVLNGRIPSMPSSALDRRPGASPSTLDRRPSSSPSPSPSSLDRRPSAPPTPLDKKHQNGTKASKPYKRTSVRVFDPNKHCGVLDPESKRPCTRSLTCKTHSLTHRRAVPGRKKQFDSLLAEHKGRLKEKEREKEKEKEAQLAREQLRGREISHSLPAQSHDRLSGTPTNCRNGKTLSPSKARLLNSYIPRTPGSRGAVGQNCCPGPTPDMVPLRLGAEGSGRPSSDEDEGAAPDDSERPDCHCSPRHPRPVGCCSFSSRLMGQGHYVFDRRWDRTRLALHRMVEKHVNSLMWRKIPLADESPAPSPGAIPATQSYLPLLSPPAAFANQSDGASMVSYSATFPPSGGGVFSIMDTSSLVAPFPAPSAMSSQGARPRGRPSRPPKAHEQLSGAQGMAEGGVQGGAGGGASGGKKKKPLLSYPASQKRNSAAPPLNPLPAGPAICSNGRPPLSAKTEPSPHDSAFTAPHPLPGDHALSVHSPLPFAAACGRKRKSSSPRGSPSKTTKTSALSGIFRKGVPEPPQTSLPRQPAVHR